VAHFKATEPLGEIVVILAGKPETEPADEEKEKPVDPMQMLMGTGKKKNKYK
jgi:hypothetical protein